MYNSNFMIEMERGKFTTETKQNINAALKRGSFDTGYFHVDAFAVRVVASEFGVDVIVEPAEYYNDEWIEPAARENVDNYDYRTQVFNDSLRSGIAQYIADAYKLNYWNDGKRISAAGRSASAIERTIYELINAHYKEDRAVLDAMSAAVVCALRGILNANPFANRDDLVYNWLNFEYNER